MKNIRSVLLALGAGLGLLAAAPAPAQTVPNGNFETWAIRGGVEAPSSWLTTDDLLGGIFGSGTVTRTTVARSGASAVQLQTQNVLGAAQFPGIIILGNTLAGGSIGVPGGLPFTARPRTLQFYYQLQGAQALSDSAGMVVLLTRRVNGTATLVAGASYFFPGQAASYTLASLPLQYTSGLAPDSVSMIFFSGTANTVTAGTVLRIDDISFTGTVTASRDAALAASLSVVPNPSPDGRYRLLSTEPALLAAPLAVLDATGRVVRRQPAPAPPLPTTARPLDLSDLPGGLYVVQLLVPGGVVTRRLSR